MWDNMYFQMDIYQKPSIPKCDGLILLETFTTLFPEQVVRRFPPFLKTSDVKNVTGDSNFSMYNLSRKLESHRISKDYGIISIGNADIH